MTHAHEHTAAAAHPSRCGQNTRTQVLERCDIGPACTSGQGGAS